jgi:hypothetical protein
VIFGGFGGMIAGAFCFLIGWWCFGFEGCGFKLCALSYEFSEP